MTNNCQARYEGGGMMRCVTCRVAWDSDDVHGACPRKTPSGLPVVAAPSLAAGLLREIAFPFPERPFHLVRHRQRHMPRAAAAFIDLLPTG